MYVIQINTKYVIEQRALYYLMNFKQKVLYVYV
jgi:hypothetical protein